MNPRVNWGAIWAGTFVSLGASFLLSFFLLTVFGSATGFGNTPPLNSGVVEAVLDICVAALAFGAGGVTTTMLGAFPRLRPALLHSLTALSIAYLINHFFFRNAFLVGRPGYPLDALFVNGATVPRVPLTTDVAWTICFSALAGLVGTCIGTAYSVRRLDAEAGDIEWLNEDRAA